MFPYHLAMWGMIAEILDLTARAFYLVDIVSEEEEFEFPDGWAWPRTDSQDWEDCRLHGLDYDQEPGDGFPDWYNKPIWWEAATALHRYRDARLDKMAAMERAVKQFQQSVRKRGQRAI